jgi:hypothetical protein
MRLIIFCFVGVGIALAKNSNDYIQEPMDSFVEMYEQRLDNICANGDYIDFFQLAQEISTKFSLKNIRKKNL